MTQTDGETNPARAPNIPLTILGQYIRDISFENPAPPQLIRNMQGHPNMDVNLALDATPVEGLGERVFEVRLRLSAKATRDQKALFLSEIDYACLAQVGADVPDNVQPPLLFIEVPKLIFPFVRAILADLTAQSGYPPLLLTPVDFYGMYVNRFGARPEETAAA